jgi:hypothetical protein
MAQNILNDRLRLEIYSGTIPGAASVVPVPSFAPASGKVFSTSVSIVPSHYSRIQRADSVFLKRFRIYSDLNAFGAQIHNNTENNVEILLKNQADYDSGDHLRIVSPFALNEWVDVNTILPPSVEPLADEMGLDRRIRVQFAGTNLVIPSLSSVLGVGAQISVEMQIEIAHTLPILSL